VANSKVTILELSGITEKTREKISYDN